MVSGRTTRLPGCRHCGAGTGPVVVPRGVNRYPRPLPRLLSKIDVQCGFSREHGGFHDECTVLFHCVAALRSFCFMTTHGRTNNRASAGPGTTLQNLSLDRDQAAPSWADQAGSFGVDRPTPAKPELVPVAANERPDLDHVGQSQSWPVTGTDHRDGQQ